MFVHQINKSHPFASLNTFIDMTNKEKTTFLKDKIKDFDIEAFEEAMNFTPGTLKSDEWSDETIESVKSELVSVWLIDLDA